MKIEFPGGPDYRLPRWNLLNIATELLRAHAPIATTASGMLQFICNIARTRKRD